MLEKMFPKNGESIPEMRFAGFNVPWEQRKFEKLFVPLKNNSLSRAELNFDTGFVKNIHYGDVLIKFGEIIEVKRDEIPYISKLNFPIKSSILLKNGDVIITDAAEDETVGKCSEIAGITDEEIVSGLHTIPCRPNIKFASGYLGYYMNSHSYHNQLLPLIQGTKISSVSKSALQDTYIVFPKLIDEQRCISLFFSNLDNLITLHQRKLLKNRRIILNARKCSENRPVL
jgi:type I restriction enzyme S subunit